MNAITQPISVRDELIAEVVHDALNEGDSGPYAFARHPAKRGLVIVEANRLERLTVAIQLIASAATALVGTEVDHET